MKVVNELTLAMPNRPGMLAKLTSALAKAGVNIVAVSVVESTTVSVIRMVTDDTGEARKVLKEMGVDAASSVKDVLALSMVNKPGALAKACQKLADKKVNIDYVYGSASGTGKSTIIVSAGSPAKAKAALGRGF
jgi:hypothetical protein